MRYLLLALCLLSACAAPVTHDAPWTPDPQAIRHDIKVCAERGLCFDASRYLCEACK